MQKLLVLLALMFIGCGDAETATQEPTPESDSEPVPSGAVSAADFGEDWPLTVKEG